MAELVKTYRGLLIAAMLMIGVVQSLFSQTAASTQITNQAKATYQYKSFPADTVKSGVVQFTVIEAPNFELSFGARDTNVFGRETLQVRLVYKNVGNLKADTATIQGILPPAGLRFVPGSTKGIISGGTVTWTVLNVLPGQADSVGVKMVVDSTLVALTQLQLNANLNWLSSQVSSSMTLVVNSFPRLEITNTPLAQVAGSGRTFSYSIVVKNTGNVQSTNTTLVDTISSLGTFVSASVTPDSIKNSQRLIVWKLGNIPAFAERTITVTVSTPPNLAAGTLSNSAVVYSANVPAGAKASVTNPIVPIVPKSITINPVSKYIFGQLNQDSSRIDIIVKDSVDQSVPNGVPVQVTTTLGTFSNNAQNISTTVQNGTATVMLRSANVANEIQRVRITALGGSPLIGTIQDTANVFMYPGAVTGIVVSGLNRTPYAGAIARVYNQSKQIVGADTTKSDGKFFVPLNKDVLAYLLEIYVIDKFGDTITTSTPIDPTKFPMPPIEIPNTIAGRILYRISGLPVPAEGVTVFLDSVSSSGPVSKSRSTGRLSQPIGNYFRLQEQKTDRLGRFKFENLKPARYVVSIDSTEFPSFKGQSFVMDTVSGTFTINLSIEIEQDSSITLVMQAEPVRYAGDTLHYSIRTGNVGNVNHYNISLTDTLPKFTSLVSVEKSKFKSVSYDTTGRIIRWTADSLTSFQEDTVRLALLLSRNIPDSTRLRNTVWYSSHVLSQQQSTVTTIVRSAPNLSFGNFFAGKDSTVAGDSVFKKIWFSNTGTDSLKDIRIVDSIFFAGQSKIVLGKQAIDSVSIVDSVVTIFVGAIPPDHADTVTIKFLSDFSLKTGTKIISRARLMQGNTTLDTATTVLTMIDNPNLSSFLKIVKTGNKKVAEIGDIVTYQIQVSNTSPTFVHTLGIFDLLPHSFRYIKNSARFNGKSAEPLLNQNLNSLTWNLADTIRSGKSGQLVYQLAIGADALESEGINTAYAISEGNIGGRLHSAPSQWQVTVRPGVFTEKGLVIGKVFYDDNRNLFQEAGETGIKDVELWMEDGTKIITGDDGKFSLPEVKPGQHVLRINEATLPKGAQLLSGNNKFAQDASSQFVRITESGIAKANFFVLRTLKDSISQLIGKVNKLFAVRQSRPKYINTDTLRGVKIDTLDMYVSFVFSGGKYLQSIDINETLPEEFSIVPGSATFNGRRINPTILGTNVQWKAGRGPDMMQGLLKYKVALNTPPKKGSSLLSVGSIIVVTADSAVVESQKLVTENIVQETEKNRIETSEALIRTVNPDDRQIGDSVTVTEGDEIFFKTRIFIDPKKKIKSVRLIDSVASNFIVNDRSFTVNGIPLPSKNLSVRVRSSALSARMPIMKNEIEFMRIASIDLTELIRSGLNEVTYNAKLNSASRDTTLRKYTYILVVDEYNTETMSHSKPVRIRIRASKKLPALALETVYVEIRKPLAKLEEKVAEAVKLVESLKQSTSKTVIMEGITFEMGKTILTKDAMVVLDNIAKTLLENPELKIQVNGHTDNTGNASANRRVSLARAKEVSRYLMEKGVSAERLFAQGFGPDKPIATNKTEEGRAKNRRVEFVRRK
ncbi:MAG: OmpA family protein [Bacteroidota bacterium]